MNDRTIPAVAADAVVFDAPFTDRDAWAVGRTRAYPEDGRNPGDNELDRIGPDYAPTRRCAGPTVRRPAAGIREGAPA